jgi:tripartite-type tricarboxylate transporter receptor subunit TctC
VIHTNSRGNVRLRFPVATRIPALCAFALLMPGAHALAQDNFTRPLRLIVSFAPGGSVDFLARIVGQKFSEDTGQQVLVDNRPGAGGNLSAELAAGAPPDGRTLYLCSPSFVINPALYRKIAYDPLKDFAPVTLLATTQSVLVAHPSLPAKNVRELIALARAHPGAINYASTGSGSSGHLTMELFRGMARIELVHVPYKVIGQALADLMAGQVSLWFPTLPGALPHIKAGRIAALAVAGSRRTAALSTTPTVAESGLPGFEASSWYALLAPAGASMSVVEQLHTRFAAIMTAPAVQEKLAAQGLEPVASTPAQLAIHLKSELEKWARVVKSSGARAD